MPEFFFHLSIELFSDSKPTRKQAEQPGSAWPSGFQALSPFFSGERPNSPTPPPELPAGSLGASPAIQGLRNLSKTDGGLGERAGALPDESQTACYAASTTISADKRLDHIYIESTDTLTKDTKRNKMNADNHISKGIGTSANGLQTKGKYEPLDQQVTDSVWGIVHLYRDADETSGLYGDSLLSKTSNPWYSRAPKEHTGKFHPPAADEDCTTLCILAVPSYLAPADFLGFVGEESREQVSHFRMIRTARANRYMVLLKFHDGKVARDWQKTWSGKVFNSMEVT
jgi:BRCA1-associated protein